MTRRPPDPDCWLPPHLELTQLSDCSPIAPEGFLRLERRELTVRFPNGATSASFVYDEISRRALDAVVIVAHFERDGTRWVYLRSALRPPLAFRPCTDADLFGTGVTWELPAGLIEPEERGPEKAHSAAVRELKEELGFTAAASDFEMLGRPVLPCPALVAEQQFFMTIEVDPNLRCEPSLDGSPLEEHGKVIAVPFGVALEQCRQGVISDSKTELGLRRLLDGQKGSIT